MAGQNTRQHWRQQHHLLLYTLLNSMVDTLHGAMSTSRVSSCASPASDRASGMSISGHVSGLRKGKSILRENSRLMASNARVALRPCVRTSPIFLLNGVCTELLVHPCAPCDARNNSAESSLRNITASARTNGVEAVIAAYLCLTLCSPSPLLIARVDNARSR